MLVLSRTKGEDVVILVGEIRFSVRLIEIMRGGKVCLGFDAPDCVKIYRSELLDRDDAKT